ncbi:MAG TPA: hypothetical protein VH720_14260 [Candidatus Limnocylindrales bacterium]
MPVDAPPDTLPVAAWFAVVGVLVGVGGMAGLLMAAPAGCCSRPQGDRWIGLTLR